MKSTGKTPGEIIREWRELRKFSQNNLATLAGISARHLSFVETGRARPGRNTLIKVGRAMQLSYRQQNALFVAAGYAPYFPEPAHEDEIMEPIWDVIAQVLNQHEPFPALVLGLNYDIIWSNHGYQKIISTFAGKSALSKYPNIYRMTFADDGLRPYFENWEPMRNQLIRRLEVEALAMPHGDLLKLRREIYEQEGMDGELVRGDDPDAAVIPFTLRNKDIHLDLISMMAEFNTAVSVTAQELRILSVFPADEPSRETYLRAIAG